MSVKEVTSSLLVFNKLSGTTYQDGSLQTDALAFDNSSDGTGKLVTASTALFDQLAGTPYQDGSTRPSIGALVQRTGPAFASEGIEADLANEVSYTTASTYISKSIFSEHAPYSMQYDDTFTTQVVVMNGHFIKEVRRQLTGTIVHSIFSPEEQLVYDEYSAYNMLQPYDTRLLPVMVALDFWLTDEIQFLAHPVIERSYSASHPWMKLSTREII